MSRRLHGLDLAHRTIIDGLTQRYISAVSLAGVGEGCPDVLAGVYGLDFLFEIKTPGGKVRASQARFHREWRGRPVAVIATLEDALRIIEAAIEKQRQSTALRKVR